MLLCSALYSKFSSRVVSIMLAHRVLSDVGELETVVNVYDAITLGELKSFLKSYYSEILITSDRNAIDWQYPVVSIGGPIPNQLAKGIGDKGLLPLWFLDMPYDRESTRVIGSAGRAEMFTSEFDQSGRLTTDVSTVARLRSPENKSQFLFIIAGNYGLGTLGAVRFLSSEKGLAKLRKLAEGQCFQAIVRCYVSNERVTDTRLVHCTELK